MTPTRRPTPPRPELAHGMFLQDAPPTASAARTFTNPLVQSQSCADPHVFFRDGWYYLTYTAGGSVPLWRSRSLTGLASGQRGTVWRPGPDFTHARDIWAPEITHLRGKWYIYFTGTTRDGRDANRRCWTLEGATRDPFGPYVLKGKLAPPDSDEYAIDATVFERDRRLYAVWSGRERNDGGPQNLYIAPMRDPWTISGSRVLLSKPEFRWETHGWKVNEGPTVLQRGGKTFLVYSASGGTTPDYCLGMLTHDGGDLLDPRNWRKSLRPVFASYEGEDGKVYTVGHNSFTRSPDGKEDWIVYHGKDVKEHSWRNRLVRAQRITWNEYGMPVFGHPVPSGVPLPLPSGEKASPRPLPGPQPKI